MDTVPQVLPYSPQTCRMVKCGWQTTCTILVIQHLKLVSIYTKFQHRGLFQIIFYSWTHIFQVLLPCEIGFRWNNHIGKTTLTESINLIMSLQLMICSLRIIAKMLRCPLRPAWPCDQDWNVSMTYCDQSAVHSDHWVKITQPAIQNVLACHLRDLIRFWFTAISACSS